MNVKYLKLWRELTHADSDSLVEDLKNVLYEWEEKEYPKTAIIILLNAKSWKLHNKTPKSAK